MREPINTKPLPEDNVKPEPPPAPPKRGKELDRLRAEIEATKRQLQQAIGDCGIQASRVFEMKVHIEEMQRGEPKHPDDEAVNRFALRMQEKLAKKRDEGRGGWEDKEQCSQEFLSQLLVEHVAKGDPVDVANFCMMLQQRGERIIPSAQIEEMQHINQSAHEQASLMHPVHQVWFRAGLLACREYMARFVEPESPAIAQSIRANWWPDLGADPGAPRLNEWGELTEGEYGDPGFKVLGPDEVSPSIEALPIAFQFLMRDLDPETKAGCQEVKPLAVRSSVRARGCKWTENDDGVWETQCGNAFVLIESTPLDNGMRFCCYCGDHIIEAPARGDEEE